MSDNQFIWAACATVALAASGPAGATAAEKVDIPTTRLAEVVVTAEKVKSSEQTTPISMQVYSGRALVDRGAYDLQALANTDPSITFAYSTEEPYVAIRGVATGNVTDTGEPSVAVATDGIFLNRSYSLASQMYDISQVEVLRGPQGTLYGRNAVGGLINIITNHPEKTFDSSGTIQVGNYGLLNTEGMLNLPLSRVLSVRFAAATYFHNGYRNNYPSATNGDDENSRSGRMEVSFDPSEHLSTWLELSYTTENDAGSIGLEIPFNGTPTHQTQDLGNPQAFPVYAPHFNIITTKDVKWSVVYDNLPDNITLTLLGGWNSIQYHHAFPQQPSPTSGWEAGGTTSDTSYFQNEYPVTQSDELRLSSAQDRRLTWQTGLYYFQEKSAVHSHFIDNYGTTFQDSNIINFDFPRDDTTSKAAYGQLSYELTSSVKITGGARYTKDSIVRAGTFNLFLQLPGIGDLHLTPNVNGRASSSKATYLADIAWNVTPANMLYAKVSTGYKAGGFTGTGSYKPESLVSYEVGSKNRFMNDSMQLNADAYLMNYTDQQLNQFTDPLAGAQTVNANSKIWGLEANYRALLGRVGTFELDGDYLHARVTGFTPPPGYNPAVSEPIVGNELPVSPPVSLYAQFEHSWGKVLGGVVTGQISAKYQGTRYFSANNFASTRAPSVTTENASISYQPDKGNWNAQLYVRNLSNRAVLIDAEEVYTGGFYLYNWAPPRTFGVRITASFR